MSHSKALEHLRAGRPQIAAELLESLLLRHSDDAKSWFLLGACRHALNDLSAAASAFSRSLTLNPANADTHLAYVTVLRAAGHAGPALAAGRQAHRRFPQNSRVLYAIAVCCEDLGQLHEAIESYEAALAIEPGFEDALHNRGLLLVSQGRHEEAEANLRRHIAGSPRSARAYSDLAGILISTGRFAEAHGVLNELDSLAPQDVSVRVRKGVVLACLRRYSEARSQFADVRNINARAVLQYLDFVGPGSDSAAMLSPENIYLGWAWKTLGQCDWTEWSEFATELMKAVSQPDVTLEPAVAFMSRLLPLSGIERLSVSRHIANAVESQNAVLPPPPRKTKARIRIGVLSPDFREHLNAYLLLPLFELHDRERFELFAYSLAADDRSAIRGRVRSAAEVFRNLQPLTDHDSAMAIRGDDIDILIDVGGYTTGARFAITAQRPARLQVNYLGFSSSLGSSRVDYAIVDRIVGGEDAEWVEQRVFLPHTHFLYDFRAPHRETRVTRQEYALPVDAFVYCAFHRAEKISPDAFDLWMQVLSRVPGSVLWFRALSETVIRNLRQYARQRGIDPARLIFAPFEPSHDPRYSARHRLGDLMLDALHHNATTSACDALCAGLPLLTTRGRAMASRNGESLLCAAGLPQLVAPDEDTFVEMAIQLAADRRRLDCYRRELQTRSAPLFDTTGRVRELEAAFQGIYDRMMRGEPPASFDVRL